MKANQTTNLTLHTPTKVATSTRNRAAVDGASPEGSSTLVFAIYTFQYTNYTAQTS